MNKMYVFFAVIVAVFLIAYFLTKWLANYLVTKGLIDIPNARSSHTVPTPRGGGVAIVGGLVIGCISFYFLPFTFSFPGIWFFVGFIIVTLTSLVDDKMNLPAGLRFLLQALAAILVLYETGGMKMFPLPEPMTFDMGWLSYPVTLFWIIAVVNIYNFLDGIDGYAAAQAVIAGIAIAVIDHSGPGFIIGSLIASASLGFLIVNWHPAKIFMGDIGSVALGFVFATLPLYFEGMNAGLGVFSVIIVLWFFLSDGAFTIIRRFIAGKKVWEAHRSHLYQRFSQSGYRHSTVVLTVMGGAAILSSIYLILIIFGGQYLYLTLLLAILAFVVYSYKVLSVYARNNEPDEKREIV